MPSRLRRTAHNKRPERLELGLGVGDQGDAHVLGARQQQVAVVAGALLPAFEHFLQRGLAGADVFGGDLGGVTGAVDPVPGAGAV